MAVAWRRWSLVGLAALVSCAPRSRVVARYPAREREVAVFPAPAGGGAARFVVVSRGHRSERVRDGFGCVSGEVPGVDVLRADHGPSWQAHLYARFDGRAAPPGEPEGVRLQNARGGSTGMRTREEAERAAADGAVQACWSADGTRVAFRTHHPAAMGANAWTRVEWTPAPRVVRWMGVAPDCAAALVAEPTM